MWGKDLEEGEVGRLDDQVRMYRRGGVDTLALAAERCGGGDSRERMGVLAIAHALSPRPEAEKSDGRAPDVEVIDYLCQCRSANSMVI